MWQSLLAGAIGGIVVSGFGIVAGALLWIRQQRWNLKREIYSELLPMLSRYYVLNRLIAATMLRVGKSEAVDPLEEKRWYAWSEERDQLLAKVDSNYGYFKLFLSEASAEAVTRILQDIRGVIEEIQKVPVASEEDREKKRAEFLALGTLQSRIAALTGEAIGAVQRSAKEDLRFAFEIPFTDYVIGEGRREPAAKESQQLPKPDL